MIQARYRLGIGTHTLGALSNMVPPEIDTLRKAVVAAADAYGAEHDRLMRIVDGSPRLDIAADEPTYWTNVKNGEEAEMVRLRRISSRAGRDFENAIENVARAEFGFRRVGEGWVSESQLAQIVATLLPGREVVRHYRSEWLEGLELDIWVPELRLGVEYQGQQHFHPVKAWGGAAGLKSVCERDARKATLCAGAAVTLIYVDYTEPLTVQHVRSRLTAFIDA